MISKGCTENRVVRVSRYINGLYPDLQTAYRHSEMTAALVLQPTHCRSWLCCSLRRCSASKAVTQSLRGGSRHCASRRSYDKEVPPTFQRTRVLRRHPEGRKGGRFRLLPKCQGTLRRKSPQSRRHRGLFGSGMLTSRITSTRTPIPNLKPPNYEYHWPPNEKIYRGRKIEDAIRHVRREAQFHQ